MTRNEALHELNNTLCGIDGCVGMLQPESIPDEKQRRIISLLQATVKEHITSWNAYKSEVLQLDRKFPVPRR